MVGAANGWRVMIVDVLSSVCINRRRLAGTERGSRVSYFSLDSCCERMRATHHAPGDPSRVLERRHCLVKIVERGAGVLVKRLRVCPPRLERDSMSFSENASRHGRHSAHQ